MDTKKLYLLGYGVLAAVALGVVGLLVYRAYSFDQTVKNKAAREVVSSAPQTITVTLSTPKSSYPGTILNAPFTVVNLLNSLNGLDIVLDAKPLGTLVKSVAGIENGDGNFWLVYVNGVMVPGNIDNQGLKDGDVVELRYNKL